MEARLGPWLRRLLPLTLERIERQRIALLKSALRACGDRVVLGARTEITGAEWVSIGDGVHIGRGAWIVAAANAHVTIGSHIMFGPECALICGNHNTREIGRFMVDVTEKRPTDDQPIVIEDDVWLGFRTTVLKGVTVHRGAITGASSVVTTDVPPYAVFVGSPARLVRFRFTPEQIVQHEQRLYPPERRMPRDELEALQRGSG